LEHWLSNIDSVLEARERLERGELSVALLKETIKNCGFCVTREGLLADQELRAVASFIDVFKYDFMHSAFLGGLMSSAMHVILEATLRVAYGRATDGRLVVVVWAHGNSVCNALTAKAFLQCSLTIGAEHCNRRCIVANASDQFSMYKLLEVFAMDVARGCLELVEHCVVCAASCRIVDVHRACKHRRLTIAVAKSELLPLIREWQERHTQYALRWV
jgi:hypothetical protein